MEKIAMMSVFISIIGILVTILLIVGIHEFGHFIVAKYAGVKVLRFSIGFGKALYKWHDKSGTEYVIALIPLGGYVKMLDENEEAVSTKDLPHAFSQQAFYKKFAIIAAGPIANLLFAFVIYWILFMVGFVTIAPKVGSVTPHSIAANAGLMPQQEIIKVDDQDTSNWTMIIINMLAHVGDRDALKMQVFNPLAKQNQTIYLNITTWHMDELKPDPLTSLGISPYEPSIPATIGKILKDSPADKAKLQVGDQVVAISGKTITDWYTMVNAVTDQPDKTLLFKIKRQKKLITLPVHIGAQGMWFFQKHGFLGLSPDFEWPKNLLRTNQYGPRLAAHHAFSDVKTFVNLNLMIFGKMITGKISFQSLGGPITIFESAGDALNQGLITFFSFLAFLSISIGVINILPVPGLDGGHLLFQIIEMIIRRPLPEKILTALYRGGFILLLLLMGQALFNDIMRLSS